MVSILGLPGLLLLLNLTEVNLVRIADVLKGLGFLIAPVLLSSTALPSPPLVV